MKKFLYFFSLFLVHILILNKKEKTNEKKKINSRDTLFSLLLLYIYIYISTFFPFILHLFIYNFLMENGCFFVFRGKLAEEFMCYYCLLRDLVFLLYNQNV